jgi:Sec-independent protein translocase protein TatA
MLMYDAVTTSWGIASVVINLSNMVFIVTVALLVMRDKRLNGKARPLMRCVV